MTKVLLEAKIELAFEKEVDLAMFAVVETGGKQYKVKENMTLDVEKIDLPEGESVVLDRVLMVKDDGNLLVGTPYIQGAKVIAKVLKHFKGEKIRVFKYKPKKNYRRRKGHRQLLTRLSIEKIEIGGDSNGS